MIMSMSGRYDRNGRKKKRQKRCRVSVVVRRRVVRHDLPAGTVVLRGGSRIADDYKSLATDSGYSRLGGNVSSFFRPLDSPRSGWCALVVVSCGTVWCDGTVFGMVGVE
jgi:hypothetical protein